MRYVVTLLCALLTTIQASQPSDDMLIVLVEARCQDNPDCRPTGSLVTIDVAGGTVEAHQPHATFHGGSFSPDVSQVIFTTWDVQTNEDQDVYLYDLDSRSARLLIPHGLEYQAPLWSPDGTRLVVVGGENDQLHIIEVESAEMVAIEDAEQVSGVPRWSPDGAQLAFTKSVAGREQVFTLLLEAGSSMQRTFEPDGAAFHAWSPDGMQFVYRANVEGVQQLFLLDVMQNTSWQFTSREEQVDFQGWSPDGQWILYAINRFAPPSSTCARHVSEDREWCVPDAHAYLWSPDGRYLAAIELVSQGNFAIELMDADGSNLRRLDLPQGVYQDLSWSGTEIVFSGSGVIYVANAVSGQVRVIAESDDEQPYYAPTWSPDCRWLVVRQFNGGRDPIYLLDTDSGEQRLLLEPDGLPLLTLWRKVAR
jgi:Tol biopolymer transport system component